MNVSCPDCRSIFRVDPAKIPPSGVRARCSVCSGVIPIPAPTGSNTPASSTPRAATPPAARTPAAAAPTRASAAPPPPPPQPRNVEPAGPTRPRGETFDRPAASATATPPTPSGSVPEFSPRGPSPFTPPASPPYNPPAPPAAPFRPAPSSAGTGTAPPFVPPTPRSNVPTPPSTPAPSGGTDAGGARRPLNPFLSKDPNQRAKRLARALVSDIITYHPAKHAEGLRDGTLKQLFREEIKKSFEEYIAQVGQQLAESTTYFQEALNEVLGGGKKIF